MPPRRRLMMIIIMMMMMICRSRRPSAAAQRRPHPLTLLFPVCDYGGKRAGGPRRGPPPPPPRAAASRPRSSWRGSEAGAVIDRQRRHSPSDHFRASGGARPQEQPRGWSSGRGRTGCLAGHGFAGVEAHREATRRCHGAGWELAGKQDGAIEDQPSARAPVICCRAQPAPTRRGLPCQARQGRRSALDREVGARRCAMRPVPSATRPSRSCHARRSVSCLSTMKRACGPCATQGRWEGWQQPAGGCGRSAPRWDA
eukprot:scaffold2611_cov356-Prasinococcus_capsulatus_cf.AAC.1